MATNCGVLIVNQLLTEEKEEEQQEETRSSETGRQQCISL